MPLPKRFGFFDIKYNSMGLYLCISIGLATAALVVVAVMSIMIYRRMQSGTIRAYYESTTQEENNRASDPQKVLLSEPELEQYFGGLKGLKNVESIDFGQEVDGTRTD